MGLNKDPRILILRQEFLNFVPGCYDGLDNPQWGKVFLGCHKNGTMRFSLLVRPTQIQCQRLGVVDPFLLGLDWSEWRPLARLHQQPHQVLPKDIPAVLLEELLAHIFITEDKTQVLRFPRQLLSVPLSPLPCLLLLFPIPKHSAPSHLCALLDSPLSPLPFHTFFP